MTPARIKAWLASKPMSTQAKAALAYVERLEEALRLAGDRFEDMATILEEGTVYTNAGFFRASARRCRQAGDGGAFHDDALAALDALKASKEGRG